MKRKQSVIHHNVVLLKVKMNGCVKRFLTHFYSYIFSSVIFVSSYSLLITNEISFTIISLSFDHKLFLEYWFFIRNYYFITNYYRNLLRFTLYIRY